MLDQVENQNVGFLVTRLNDLYIAYLSRYIYVAGAHYKPLVEALLSTYNISVNGFGLVNV